VRSEIEIYRGLGLADDTQAMAAAFSQLGSILGLQGRWQDAAQVYGKLETATATWETQRRDALLLTTEYIATLYRTTNLAAGIAAAERLLVRDKALFGEQHIETALVRGLLGIGYARAQRHADALHQFRQAVPILMARSRETDDDNPAITAAREQRTQIVVESYIASLAHMGSAAGVDATAEAFRLTDSIRSRSVQHALAASTARAVASHPALADLVRKAQDMEKQVGAQLGLLNNVLALPSQSRDDNAVRMLQADIEKLRVARDAAKKEIAAGFPAYSGLVEPAPPTVDDVRAVLRHDEAFVSFYFGRDSSFVWALSRTGPLAFARIDTNAGDLERKVGALRRALEPRASMISDIPPFDVPLAHELYGMLLKPVEQGWKSSKNLIVATNGALGLLPLGLLVTERSQISRHGEPYFAEYRGIPWLARTHAVSLVPSASALRTLRQLPPGAHERDLIGFGDPIFSQQQSAETEDGGAIQLAEASTLASTRGVPLRRRAAVQTASLDSAELGNLPRLPDTADELRAIALALQADPARALKLGKTANEQTVKDTDLTRYRVIVFATHGLVPGDLNGLTQPALALTAPSVAEVSGDGLLTMEEILALKLNADWVVLSACNTAAGAGAGAEAASGLGRAFFYAGTRAILVTNWSVHSASARELVADLFRRQAADPQLTRAEALRQATMALADGPGFTNEKGETLFSYAHPLFWAPYTIIGDGGGNVQN
jgi:CHAT domain-containing protein